jgi:cytochrome P450
MDDFDIHDPAFAACPFVVYDKLREGEPIHPSERYGGFHLLTRYADVRAAALDWRRFTSSVVGVTAIPVVTPRTEPQLPIELDPPLHSTYRALINPTFGPARIAKLEHEVEALAARLLAGMAEAGACDVVSAYCAPLALGTLALFTGLPAEDTRYWQAWLDAMFDPKRPEKGKTASTEFGEYIDGLIRRRQADPSDDFISLLLAAEIDGRKLTEREVHSFVRVMFGAGFETTADALSGALFWLSRDSENLDELRSQFGSGGIAAAAEELLRHVSPIQMFGRNATADIVLHGVAIPKGRIVALGFGAANRDPQTFDRPEECILSRSPNRHLAFGAGPHLCLGAPVARLEMTTTLRLLARHVSRLSPGAEAEPIWKSRGDRRGLSFLPLVVEGDAIALRQIFEDERHAAST